MSDSITQYYEQIGKYLLTEEVGRGGSGVIYKAKDLELGRYVAIKKLINSEFLSEDNKSRFNKEAITLASLSHPSIMSVYEILQDDSNSIVMEFLDGLNLESFIKYKKPNLDTILYIFIQIGEALSYLHSKNIIHRDIKPENITIIGKNMVKVTDFGIAMFKNDSDTLNDSLVGTLNYMSPEQLYNSKTLDSRSDIFSFGVMMYQLFTGELPFKGDDAQEVITKIFSKVPEKPSSLNQNLNSEMDEIILQALEKDPEKRNQNIQEIVDKISFERLKLSLSNINYSLTETNITLNTESNNINPSQTHITGYRIKSTEYINNITKSLKIINTSESIYNINFTNYQVLIILRKYIDDKKTGSFTIESENIKGEIFIKNGEVTTAEISSKNIYSVDAFFEMVLWNKGTIKFDSTKTSGKSEFEYMPTELLFIEGYEVLTEYHNLIKKYRKNVVPKVIDSTNPINIYDSKVRDIYNLIDGNENILTIKMKSKMDTLSALKSIDKLVKSNVIGF